MIIIFKSYFIVNISVYNKIIIVIVKVYDYIYYNIYDYIYYNSIIKLLTILIKLCVRIYCRDKNISVNSIKVLKSIANHLQQRKHLLKQQWSYSMLSNINLKKVKSIIIMYFLKIHLFRMINMNQMFKLLI